MNELAVWDCKIGEVRRSKLPHGSDAPMRRAVEIAYQEVTGEDSSFCFSGWGGRLNEIERSVVENREANRPSSWRDMADILAEALRLTREYVGEELLPPIEGWSWFDAMQAYETLTASDPV